jgi:hypothetical protein
MEKVRYDEVRLWIIYRNRTIQLILGGRDISWLVGGQAWSQILTLIVANVTYTPKILVC